LFLDINEWAKLQESLLKPQLKVIHQFLKKEEEPQFKPRGRDKSQISVMHDILLSSQKPLHVTDIIVLAKKNFKMDLDRESIVSAITKKVKSGRMFERVAPNTFTILKKPEENTS
jgi:hypothetical protein